MMQAILRLLLLLVSVLTLSSAATAQSLVMPMGEVMTSQLHASEDGLRFALALKQCFGSMVFTTIKGPMITQELQKWPVDPRSGKKFGRVTVVGVFNDGRYVLIGQDRTGGVDSSCLLIVDSLSTREIAREILTAKLSGNARYIVYVAEIKSGQFRYYRHDLVRNTTEVIGETGDSFYTSSADLEVSHDGSRALVRFSMPESRSAYLVLTMKPGETSATFVPTSLHHLVAALSMDGDGERLWMVVNDSTRQTPSTIATLIKSIDPVTMTVDRTITVPDFHIDTAKNRHFAPRNLVVDRTRTRFGWNNDYGYVFLYDDNVGVLQHQTTQNDRISRFQGFLPGDSLCLISANGFHRLHRVADLSHVHSVVGLQSFEFHSLRLSPDMKQLLVLPDRRLSGLDVRSVSIPDMHTSTSLSVYHAMDSYDDNLYYSLPDSSVVQHNISTGQVTKKSRTPSLLVTYECAANDGIRFLYSADDGDSTAITVVDGRTGGRVFRRRHHDPTRYQLSTDGKVAVIDGHVWDVDADTLFALPRPLKYSISPDGRYAVFHDARVSGSTIINQIKLYDLRTQTETVFAERGIIRKENKVTFSRDGSSILMITPDGEFARYSLADGKRTHLMKLHIDQKESTTFFTLDYISKHDAFVIMPDYHRVEIIAPVLTSIPDDWSTSDEPPLINIVYEHLDISASNSPATVQVCDLSGRGWSAPYSINGLSMRVDLGPVPEGICLVVITNVDGSVQRHVALKMAQ